MYTLQINDKVDKIENELEKRVSAIKFMGASDEEIERFWGQLNQMEDILSYE